MISEKMYELGSKRSVIRELFEYGKKRAAEIGGENVYDFSIGNPSIPAPNHVKEVLCDLLEHTDPILLHGYTSAPGDISVRKAIAEHINQTHGTSIGPDNLYMTSGAAASVSICLKALTIPGDEYITFAPYFPEYKVFVEAAGGKLNVVSSQEDTFQIDFDKLESALTPQIKAILINSPNNPSGVVYTEESLCQLCRLLEEKSAEYGHTIYLISDEPYRELVYEGETLPYLINYYPNTFVCYSYSKSLSLPGERIGYIVVSNKMQDWETVYAAVCGAGRALGYVCASSLFQRVIVQCLGETSDISKYKENRDLLYNGLRSFGFQCVRPDGAFYLFMKTPESDANAFCERAKKYELLLVPGDDFGCSGFVRIAYCVKKEQILSALPAFEKLAKEYKLK